MTGVQLAAWLIDMSIDVSLLIGFILLIRRRFVQVFGAGPGYLLWAIPALRILFSVLPVKAQGLVSSLFFPEFFNVSLLSIEYPETLASIVCLIWVVGFIVFVLCEIYDQVRFRRQVLQITSPLAPAHGRQLDRYCQRMGIFPAIDALHSPAVSGPLLLGLWAPKLVLPIGFFETTSEPELVIRHELVHLKRRDIAINLVARMLRCIFWFNPLMVFAESRFRADQEVACDSQVLASEPMDKRRAYGLAMLASVGTPLPQAAAGAGFVDTRTLLKERTEMIAQHQTRWLRTVAGAATLAALALFGIGYGVEVPAAELEWNPAQSFAVPLPGRCS